jgi:hypothetical protein
VLLTGCRYLALAYAVGLAIAETALNTAQGQWQYAPMWVIDYLVVAYLLIGFFAARRGRGVPVLMSAYALAAGVMYMAFFADFDPALPAAQRGPTVVVALIGLALGVSVVGLVGTTAAWARRERAPAARPA